MNEVTKKQILADLALNGEFTFENNAKYEISGAVSDIELVKIRKCNERGYKYIVTLELVAVGILKHLPLKTNSRREAIQQAMDWISE